MERGMGSSAIFAMSYGTRERRRLVLAAGYQQSKKKRQPDRNHIEGTILGHL